MEVTEDEHIEQAQVSRGKTLLQINTRACMFPVGRIDGTHLFCAKPPRDAKSSYCPHHHAVVWVTKKHPGEDE